jgi:hypothetical protein
VVYTPIPYSATYESAIDMRELKPIVIGLGVE